MSETTTDHEKIRKWAEKHGGKPAVVKSTHGERGVGIIRIEFPNAPNSRTTAWKRSPGTSSSSSSMTTN